jgi:hypothetical protein
MFSDVLLVHVQMEEHVYKLQMDIYVNAHQDSRAQIVKKLTDATHPHV